MPGVPLQPTPLYKCRRLYLFLLHTPLLYLRVLATVAACACYCACCVHLSLNMLAVAAAVLFHADAMPAAAVRALEVLLSCCYTCCYACYCSADVHVQ